MSVCVCVESISKHVCRRRCTAFGFRRLARLFFAPSMDRSQFCCLKGLFRQKQRARVDSTPRSTQISPKWREPQKSPKVVDFVQPAPFAEAISKAPSCWISGFLDRQNARKPHKSPTVVDFVEPAPFAEGISKAPSDLLEFQLLGPPPQKPKSCRFCRACSRPLRIC